MSQELKHTGPSKLSNEDVVDLAVLLCLVIIVVFVCANSFGVSLTPNPNLP